MSEAVELPIEGKPMGQVTDSEAIDALLTALSGIRRNELSDQALEEHIHRIGLAVPVMGRLSKVFREAIDNYVHKHGPIAKDDTHDWAITLVVKKEVKMLAFSQVLAQSVETQAGSGITMTGKLAQIPLKPSQAERLLGAPLSDDLLRQFDENRLKAVKNLAPGRLDDAAKKFLTPGPLLSVDLVPNEPAGGEDGV